MKPETKRPLTDLELTDILPPSHVEYDKLNAGFDVLLSQIVCENYMMIHAVAQRINLGEVQIIGVEANQDTGFVDFRLVRKEENIRRQKEARNAAGNTT